MFLIESGLIQAMDAFLGRRDYSTYLGIEALYLRQSLPLNVRAFVAAVEQHSVLEYVKNSKNPCLKGLLDGIVESYAGERGFMGVHRCTFRED